MRCNVFLRNSEARSKVISSLLLERGRHFGVCAAFAAQYSKERRVQKSHYHVSRQHSCDQDRVPLICCVIPVDMPLT